MNKLANASWSETLCDAVIQQGIPYYAYYQYEPLMQHLYLLSSLVHVLEQFMKSCRVIHSNKQFCYNPKSEHCDTQFYNFIRSQSC